VIAEARAAVRSTDHTRFRGGPGGPHADPTNGRPHRSCGRASLLATRVLHEQALAIG
jgi:hypothetical protein